MVSTIDVPAMGRGQERQTVSPSFELPFEGHRAAGVGPPWAMASG